jgi:hypothetical protein
MGPQLNDIIVSSSPMIHVISNHDHLRIFSFSLKDNGRIVPRYGKSKYNTGGKYPEPAEKDICPQHSVGMTHLKCNASWSFSFSVGDGNTDPAWKVIHKGLHEHPAPFPIGASKSAKKTLHKYLSVDPNLTASALLRGNDIRRPIYEADIKFGSPDYLRHSLLREFAPTREERSVQVRNWSRQSIRLTRHDT